MFCSSLLQRVAVLLFITTLGACSTSRFARPPKDVCHPSESDIAWIWSRDKADFERALAEHFRTPKALQVAYTYTKSNQLYAFPAGIVYTQNVGYDTKSGRRRLHETLVETTQPQTSLLHALARRDLEETPPQGWVESSHALQKYAQTFAQGEIPSSTLYSEISQAICAGSD